MPPTQCNTCLHWKARTVESSGSTIVIGHCRRNAPCGVTDAHHTPNAQWPTTLPTDLCGDYEPTAL